MSLSPYHPYHLRDTRRSRRSIIVATDAHGDEIGRAILRAYDTDQARRFARRLLVWCLGAITLADAGWDRTLVARETTWAKRKRQKEAAS